MVAGCRNAGLLVWDCCPSRAEETRSSDPDTTSKSWAPSYHSNSAAAPRSLPTRHGPLRVVPADLGHRHRGARRGDGPCAALRGMGTPGTCRDPPRPPPCSQQQPAWVSSEESGVYGLYFPLNKCS